MRNPLQTSFMPKPSAAMTATGARIAFVCATLIVAACAGGAFAADAPGETQRLRLLRSGVVPFDPPPVAVAPSHRMRLFVALIAGTGWSVAPVLDGVRSAGAILAQCGISIRDVEIREYDGPERFRMLSTRHAREYAVLAGIGRPALFFVADTLHRPAFDAEAFGRGNTRTRPELADTVWITAPSRDLPIVIAHELAHVLADSGAHSGAPGNLMREDTAPENNRLEASQCEAIVATGTANGLLEPIPRAPGGGER